MSLGRATLIWTALAVIIVVPIAAAATSPLLQWRQPVYILAGFAGVVAMALLFLQPLLVGGYLPGLSGLRGRRAHRWMGGALVAAIVLHVAGLWITSPPDVVDALLFRSPTPFSAWGVIAMWVVFANAVWAVLRRKLRMSPRRWRSAHIGLAVVIVLGSVVHAMLIEGTMETVTKALLCLAVLLVMIKVGIDLRVWPVRGRGKA
ncbi:ferric reductase-like transmembrane domain-containing protein [Roseibium sp.]|uniref:ferric reductase-like transmembrane domain-containing protein n=1 Tax=Roseibium sp. TaxID=1936156 RepID=UPI003A971EF7